MCVLLLWYIILFCSLLPPNNWNKMNEKILAIKLVSAFSLLYLAFTKNFKDKTLNTIDLWLCMLPLLLLQWLLLLPMYFSNKKEKRNDFCGCGYGLTGIVLFQIQTINDFNTSYIANTLQKWIFLLLLLPFPFHSFFFRSFSFNCFSFLIHSTYNAFEWRLVTIRFINYYILFLPFIRSGFPSYHFHISISSNSSGMQKYTQSTHYHTHI